MKRSMKRRALKIENHRAISPSNLETLGPRRRLSVQMYSVIEPCFTSIRVDLKGLTRVVTNARRRAAAREFALKGNFIHL